ncbi:hypothetical protein [Sinomicrobium weinanense]|uniref:Uncharacterized protein n=1 Tax=Sinomicrobium weinanense TaxID=2842200 RepID=A0A926JQP9_9FLAO|nr:hypothetical protein [Sinomicrobium weinanense]MBC9795501.1 hypothetical protein [Sinomicrobium weinanense]MBU3123352.1 hypothetical protein [Sinomicrobium weinanense]
MPVTVKYIVLTEDHAHWIIDNTKAQYRRLFEDHPEYAAIKAHIDNTYVLEPLVKSHNDFSKQMLMAFEDATPLASAELLSSLPDEKKPEGSSKPLLFHKIVHNSTEKGLPELLHRAEEIARQRKHDALVVKLWDIEKNHQKTILDAGFETLGTETVTMGGATVEQLSFQKKVG